MTESRLDIAYCDESCDLEHDGIPIMALGAVTCPEREFETLRCRCVCRHLKESNDG